MKLFHISDLHIGLKLQNRDLSEDQIYILERIVEAAEKEKPDVIMIAGDIYDKSVPSAEAVMIFDHFLSALAKTVPNTEIMMISGNHDSAPRVNMFRDVLKHIKIHMVGMPPQLPGEHIEKVTLKDTYGEVDFYLLPFVKPSMVKAIVGTDENGNNVTYNETIHRLINREEIDSRRRNILLSHQFYLPVGQDADKVERMESEIRTVGNIDEVKGDILELFDYAALGHIHKPMKVGSEYYRYCGTPMACSVSEAGQKKGIVIVEMEKKGRISTRIYPLVPLHEIKILKGDLEELLKQGCMDYVTAVVTDAVDLDVFDMQDRLHGVFPNLLEIRREMKKSVDYEVEFEVQEMESPFELCKRFLAELDSEDEEILQDVMNEVGVN